MSVRIDWDKLAQLPDDEDKSFEKFCFHIAIHKFGECGTVSYFYNTPGSEFYIELNKPIEYAGINFSIGDVIGWQAKYWKAVKDKENSPLDANHISELVKGFEKTIDYRANTKLWIVCSPGCFVQKQWDTLIEKLQVIKNDCLFESWHKDIFEHFYIDNPVRYNGIFQYYFGVKFIGKELFDRISKDTLSCLETKFDVDLHTPTEFEKSLLSIVDEDIARQNLSNRITSLYNHLIDDKKKTVLDETLWGYEYLSDTFKESYINDIHIRYNIIEQLYSFLSILKDSPEYIKEIFILINEYVVKRRERVDLLNKEIGLMLKKNKRNNIDYSLHELVDRIHFLENKLTGSSEDKDDCLWSLIKLLCQKDFSIFAEAGYGKTHFACSLANNMLNRGLPILFLTGSQFRNCSSCESKLLEILNLPQGTLIDDIFDSMNFMGEIFHCKFPIIIDGLNESAPNEQRWKDELPPLRRKITERKNLLFITTCREKDEYIEVIYGRKKYTEVNNFVHLNGIEEKDLDKATERYFKKYNIHPTNIISSGVFNNPLLLKVFCITNRGRCDFELNDYSLASCMKDYSEQLLNMIATHNGRSDRFKRFKIESNLNKISQLIWERNNRCLNFYTDFASVFEEDTEKFLDEGMCFLLDRVGNEEQIQFSYDMVAGYHIAKSILDKYNDAKDFCNFIERNKDYLYGINRHTLAEDISKSLFYLVPLKFHKEWYELMPNENVIISSMDHLDIIIASESGRKALITLIEKNNLTSSIKEKICNSLFKRVYNQSNLKYISLFVPFFLNLTSKEFDLFWNFQFSN